MDYKFNQTEVKVIDENRIDIYLRLPIFKYPKKLYEITKDDQTLRTVPKSYENLIHTLSCGSGLGINIEVLRKFKFKYIEVKYNTEVLRTTYKHFMEKSVLSPFMNDRIDQQRVLSLKDWYEPFPEEKKETEIQETLFSEVGNGKTN